MVSLGWLFLYSPFPYWAAFTILFYRHDLTRIIHPVREHAGLKTWWLVCRHLGLIGKAEVPKPSGRSACLPYLVGVSSAAVASLSWTLRLLPPAGYDLLLAQTVSGLILSITTSRYLGPLPSRPHADALRYPRLGSRVRHLPKESDLGEYRDYWRSEEEPAEEGSPQPFVHRQGEPRGEE